MIREEWQMDAEGMPVPDNSNLLLLNIETTGLYARSSYLYMAGFAWPEKGHYKACTLLAQSRREEPDILEEIRRITALRPAIRTFGGRTFSYQYLNERYANEHEGILIAENQTGGDLQRKIAPLQEILGLTHIKKTAVEEKAGFRRSGVRTGGELIDIYQSFERTQDEETGKVLLLHSREDLYSLAVLMRLEMFSDFFAGNTGQVVITDEKTRMHAVFSMPAAFLWPVQINTPFIRGELSGTEAHLFMPVKEGRLYYFLQGPCRDYYYLPEEDRAVHKSVAVFVDRKYRRRATPDTLYVPKDGRFVQVPPALSSKYGIFRRERKDPAVYLPVDVIDEQVLRQILPCIAEKE